ncbi:uncharacterized protein LOC129780520 [Toxorhynchites rutilus septentrionalis]|uniref:uncharacterized protein LOC129780520 n=1 Tax=Toxorhynchites rutilus septentrionalis TaxID=329112 RepID=UPI002479D1DB|nr:uncharacterized protein LOC129780520 [Toxorhynchites rutilus septentrionalis]XP_055644830.1 uncharacterized protein LOC129780520 [Toxorhynchites rutilus septentrionalis]XP_055644831.1 uncharacterized protein LOC129780520 [Toxorhynchites rutilus septentrionalis]XP_055644832.1 uncharacterized protein LOC129780520 [Toxorhynchites rutilus septentrionalis]XP_055644833.1 uncharacterized protein LOC129780520 [Toxorhynchites rutilus septentrionalis]
MPHNKSQLVSLIKGRGQAGFSEYEVLKIFCDVCESLAQLHCGQSPVIYRDLKVENVIQNDMGRFILAETETATTRFWNPVAHGKKTVEEEIQKNTTASYRAPEMIDLNSGHSITTKVDIWALGCLLYRLCFGTAPFGDSSKAILYCQYNIPEVSKYSLELYQLIRLLLEPDPEKRPSIYQVCEFAFKIADKDNPLRIIRERQRAQPAANPCMSEQTEKKTMPVVVGTAAISSTSVTPRSRPKPQQPNPPGFNLVPLALNSASPKNTVSPVPGAEATTAGQIPEKSMFIAKFSDKFPQEKSSTKSPTSSGKEPLISGNEHHHRSVADSGFRFFTSEANHLMIPPSSPATSKEKSATVSPASLLSPFEQEPPSSSSSSTRSRPTTLLAAPTAQPSKPSSSSISQVHRNVLSNSNSEKSLLSPISSSTWNPFGDPSSFSPNSTLTEDQLFGAEFDKLRLEGSQTSIVTSPEEMKSERTSIAAAVPASWLRQPQHQRFSLPTLAQAASTGVLASSSTGQANEMGYEEDPFSSAPFTLPKRLKDKTGRSSKLSSKLSEVISSASGSNLWRHSTGGGKESLIAAAPPGTVSTENGNMDNGGIEMADKSSLLGIKLDDLISGGEKGSPNFIKLPLDDRNKYEKLNSNDVTSDDSDAEFHADSTGGVKKQSFKQFVESNIPEKLQAVYHKVDKSQIKNVQIVKKLRGKVVQKDDTKKGHRNSGGRKGKTKNDNKDGDDQNNRESDDSIGSASDLRANDEFIDGDETENGKVVTGKPVKKFNRHAFGDGSVDDCISESIKTCGSSAYHAECESVTTNEDNTSRIVTRIRVKKREHDSKHSVIDEDDSGEEDMLHGDKPLLLDDELDYESAPETNTSGEEVPMDPFTPESLPDEKSVEKSTEEDEVQLDPFAMAPFRKPAVPKRNSIKFMPNIHPIPESCPTFPIPSSSPVGDFCTSTPVKPTPIRSQPTPTELLLPVSVPQTIISPLSGEPSSPMSPILQTDLFGSEPFPLLISSHPISMLPLETVSIPTVTVEPGSVTLTHIIPSAKNPIPALMPESTSTVGQKQQQQSSQMSARQNYINYSQISMQNIASISPDNNYVNFDPDDNDDDIRKLKSDDCDDSSDTVVKSSSKASGFLSKKEKVKYNSLKDKTGAESEDSASVSSTSFTGNHVLVIPAKLSQKVKVNVGGYKKVTSKGSKKEKSNGIGAEKYEELHCPSKPNGKSYLSKPGKNMAFSNMSFEDFPSDESLEEQQPASSTAAAAAASSKKGGGGKLVKIAPFEVIRNEKMLLEAEKKFGSLKRRSNPFS